MRAQRKEEHYNYRAKSYIRERVIAMDDQTLPLRERFLASRQSMLTEQWLATVGEGKNALREGINESIKIVKYELDMVHVAMKRRKLAILPDDITKEMVIQELIDNQNSEHT